MLVVRKLMARESKSLERHLLRLSAEDRRLRFGYATSAPAIAAYVKAMDWGKTWAIGAFSGARLCGIVELTRCDPWWAMGAELSVSVEKRYQNRGLGTRLVAETLLIARNRGFRTVYLLCLPENRPIQRIARKFDGQLTAVEGELEARIRPPQPTPLSVMVELFNDNRAILQCVLEPPKRQRSGRQEPAKRTNPKRGSGRRPATAASARPRPAAWPRRGTGGKPRRQFPA